MDELYESDYSRFTPYKSKMNINVRCEKIAIKKYGFKTALLWNIATMGKAKIYAVYDGEKRVHTSYVVHGNEKFRFLHNKDIEIGPCWTHDEYRGRGIYPAVLSYIIKEELAEGGTAYMIIHEKNKASQHGVAKVGFRKTGFNVKRDALKRYSIE